MAEAETGQIDSRETWRKHWEEIRDLWKAVVLQALEFS